MTARVKHLWPPEIALTGESKAMRQASQQVSEEVKSLLEAALVTGNRVNSLHEAVGRLDRKHQEDAALLSTMEEQRRLMKQDLEVRLGSSMRNILIVARSTRKSQSSFSRIKQTLFVGRTIYPRSGEGIRQTVDRSRAGIKHHI